MKLIVGLGNPGIEYQFTPHNLGFLTIDRIARDLGVEVRNRQCRALTARTVLADQMVLLAKPETFMNLSGISVKEEVAATPEAAAEAAAAGPAEPEVIKKGKQETEEEGAEAAPEKSEKKEKK